MNNKETNWKTTLHKAIVPLLSQHDIEVLIQGLTQDQDRLCQGEVVICQDNEVCSACAIGYILWQSRKHTSEKAILRAFSIFAHQVIVRLRETGLPEKLWLEFLEWFDDNDPQTVFSELAQELKAVLA